MFFFLYQPDFLIISTLCLRLFLPLKMVINTSLDEHLLNLLNIRFPEYRSIFSEQFMFEILIIEHLYL